MRGGSINKRNVYTVGTAIDRIFIFGMHVHTHMFDSPPLISIIIIIIIIIIDFIL